MSKKKCVNCQSEFETKPHAGHAKTCSKECSKKYWYAQRKATGRRKDILRKFGMTPEHYDKMLGAQNGVCAICKTPPNGKNLAVDHDHATGKNRQLLCERCNLVLGKVQDNQLLLMHMVSYLQRFE